MTLIPTHPVGVAMQEDTGTNIGLELVFSWPVKNILGVFNADSGLLLVPVYTNNLSADELMILTPCRTISLNSQSPRL